MILGVPGRRRRPAAELNPLGHQLDPMHAWLRRLALFVTAGAVINVGVAWACASQQPTWRRQVTESPPAGYALEFEQFLRSRLTFREVFPQLLRRCGRISIRATGWRANLHYGDAAWGSAPQLTLEVRRLVAGWPFPSLAGEHHWIRYPASQEHAYFGAIPFGDPKPASGNGAVPFSFLPFRPLPAGFAANLLLYTLIIWSLWLSALTLRRALRRRRNRCPACGYPVGSSSFCTECGGSVRVVA